MSTTYVPVPVKESFGRSLTKKLLIIVPLCVGVYDASAYLIWGNDATVSKTMFDTSELCSLFSTLLLLTVGTLMGHFIVPQHIWVVAVNEQKTDFTITFPPEIPQNMKDKIKKVINDELNKILEDEMLSKKWLVNPKLDESV